jgi:uroporphyrin-III C-methyltransferase / precorrin-2 dehydrogenase / sirohydrochlorin ferrochelatase
MRYLPVFLDLEAGPVVLVGSGEPALNKLRLLRASGARVRWYADDMAVARHCSAHDIEVRGQTGKADLSGAVAVVAAAGDPVDAEIAARAHALRVPVNVVDRPDLSTFIVPAIVDRGDVVVAIGTGGAAPVLARRLRARIEALLPARIGALSALMGRYRAQLAAAVTSAFARRRFWEKVLDGPIAASLLAGRPVEAEAELVRAINSAKQAGNADAGTVFLVGAGPGDPDLLTLRALHVLHDADVVFHDELVTAAVLDRARRDAERVPVGRRHGERGIGQDEINRALLAAARSGKRVVRLKGGDPLVFGRGGEELDYLRAHGVRVVVVPGITAALGCAAEAGLPLTLRNAASRLSFLTAHRAADAAAIDWTAVAGRETTLVAYMGRSSAAAVRAGLMAAGRAGETPAAVLARGTRPDSASVVGCLDELPALVAAVGSGPALLVIGDVVRHSALWHAEMGASARSASEAA